MLQVREIGPLLRRRHGVPVRKLCVTLGATCPNRDGAVGRGGCTFCNAGPPSPAPPIREQLRRGRDRLGSGIGIIVYFQDHSATHVAGRDLDAALSEVGQTPGVLGITVGTRPDCLPDDVLDVLAEHARHQELMVELGLQSASDAVLQLANRCHTVACFESAVYKLHRAGARVCAHVVLGLPAPHQGTLLQPESSVGAAATARLLGATAVEAVKIHNCHVLQHTVLARLYAEGRYAPPDRDAYLELLVAFLEHLPGHVEIHRLVGEARPPELVAPAFTANKGRTLQWLRQQLERRHVVQGHRATLKAPPFRSRD
jgi:hypothetical protein